MADKPKQPAGKPKPSGGLDSHHPDGQAKGQVKGQAGNKSAADTAQSGKAANKWQKIVKDAEDSPSFDDAKSKASTQSQAAQQPGAKSNKAADNADATADFLAEEQELADSGEFADIPTDEASLEDFLQEDPRISKLTEELTATKQKYLQLAAQMKNQTERSEREMKKARLFANERIIKKLLPVMDSLVRGLESVNADSTEIQGMQLTLDLLEKTLQEFGVEVINPAAGEVFDPELHEAMSVQQDAQLVDNSVVKVLQRGYKLQDRVLRAAMVIVNRQ